MPDTRKYVDYQGLVSYDSKLKKWTKDLIGKIESGKSDWNENDSKSPSYIENRTHYKEPNYWNFSDLNVNNSQYSLNTEGLNFNPEMFVYEVSIDNGDFIEVVPSYGVLQGWTSLGNSEYFPSEPLLLFKKVAEDSGMGDLNFSITSVSDDGRIIFSSDNNESHTIEIKSKDKKIPFLENHYVYLSGEVPSPVDLEEGLQYNVFVDGDVLTLTAHKIKLNINTGEAFDGMALGNGALVADGFSIIASLQGQEIESAEYDESIDTDSPVGFIFPKADDSYEFSQGLFFSNTREISEVSIEDSESPVSVEMMNVYDYMGQDTPTEVDITFETEPSTFKSKVLSIHESNVEGSKTINDFLESGDPLIVEFNGETYELPFRDPEMGYLWDSIFYDAKVMNGTKDWGFFSLLGNNSTPFLIAGPLGNPDNKVYEIIFKEEYSNQDVSFQLKYESGSIIHQLDKEYVPNPTWEEVENKPDWVTKRDVLSLFWGDSSNLFQISDGTLMWADDVDVESIDYPVMFPSVLNGEKVYYLETSLNGSSATGVYFDEGLDSTQDVAKGVDSIEEAYIYTERIGSKAFENCTGLKTVEIGDSVTNIDSRAFSGCTSLEKANLPSNLTYINSYIFEGCENLKSLTIPKSVTNANSGAFGGCSNCKFTIEYGMTEIPSSLFNGAEAKSISIPSTVTSIGTSAFSGLTIEQDIRLPEGLTYMGNYCFFGSNISEIEIPEGVTFIPQNGFQRCSDLEYCSILGNATGIGKQAFADCSKLEEIQLPDSVSFIGESAFSGCSALQSVNIPSSLSSLPNYVFQNCSSLTSIDLPSSLTSLGTSAFENCSSLTTIDASNVGVFGMYAFKGCTSLTSVQLPGQIINDNFKTGLFQECSSLTDITLPSNLTSLPSYLLYGCTSLASISIPSSVTRINPGVFERCSSLTGVVLPQSLTYIGTGAFRGCSSLTSLDIPSTVTTIGDFAFTSSGITSLTIPDSIQYPINCVRSCTSLKNLTLGNNVKGTSYISSLTSLETLTINTVTPPRLATADPLAASLVAIYVPASAVDTYKASSEWSPYASIIQAIQ